MWAIHRKTSLKPRKTSEELNGRIKWVAFKNQFFSSVLIPRTYFTSAGLNSRLLNDDPTYLKDMDMKSALPYNTADGAVAAFDFYFGPNDYPCCRNSPDQDPRPTKRPKRPHARITAGMGYLLPIHQHYGQSDTAPFRASPW